MEKNKRWKKIRDRKTIIEKNKRKKERKEKEWEKRETVAVTAIMA